MGFNIYRFDRTVSNNQTDAWRGSGGVAVLINSELHGRRLVLDRDDSCECVAVEVKLKPIPLIIYAAYMRVFDISVAMKHVSNIKKLCNEFNEHRIMILGDFNITKARWTADESNQYYLPTNVDVNVNEFLKQMHELPFYQLSNITNAFGNVLDLVFVNELGEFDVSTDESTIIAKVQQDPAHVPYEITFTYCKKSTSFDKVSKEVICYKSGHYERMEQQIERTNFQHEINSRDAESAFEFFNETITRLMENNIPKKTITINGNKEVWWTKQLQVLKNRRDKLFKRSRKGNDTTEYIKVLNEFDQLSTQLYEQYIKDVQANIKSNPNEFWRFAKLNQKSSLYTHEMQLDENVASTPSDIVELFADFFESNYRMDEEQWSFDDVYTAPSSYREVNVSLLDMETAIHSLEWQGGIGPDGIPPFVIKMCVETLTWPLWLLFQKTFEEEKIPKALKLARVVPVFKKKGKRKDIKNYRVVVISSAILKIFQRAVKIQLASIIDPHLVNPQHGFRPKRSVTTNLMTQSIMANEAFEKRAELDTFLGDYESAFDRVIHRLLISKLPTFSIGPRTAKWIYAFLIEMKYYVQIGNSKSRVYESTSGIIPGSVLGPTLFLVFINDVVDVVKHSVVLLFADDLKLLKIIMDWLDVEKLQSDIDRLNEWSSTNRLYFNKSKCAIFSAFRTVTSINATYKLEDHVIERKEVIRDLGIPFDHKFTFGYHIEQLTSHSRQMIGYIHRISNGRFTKETLKILYLSYVRSKLEFASTIWSPYQQVYIDDIESIQKQFVIDALDNRRNASSYRLALYSERCEILNIQPLKLRRQITDVMFAYDVYHGNVNDTYLSSKFVRAAPVRDLRANRIVEERFYATDYLTNQPVSRLRNIMNNFANLLTETRSRSEFKTEISRRLTLDYKNEEAL